MANILFISGSYFPNATANAVCAKKFEDALKSQGNKVLYCNRRHDLFEKEEYCIDDTHLYTVASDSDTFYRSIEIIKSLKLPNHMGVAFRNSALFYRVVMRILNFGKDKRNRRKEANDAYIQKYSDKICEIVEKHHIEVIISVSMPFNSHLAVKAAVNKLSQEHKPKWIAYSIDTYWSKAGIDRKDIPQMKTDEHSVFQACDCILMLDAIEKDYGDSEYDCYRDKMKSLPLPLFDLSAADAFDDGFEKKTDVAEIVFTGTVYDDFRNMNAFIHVAEMFKGKPYRFHFMGKIYPKSLAMLKQLQDEMPTQIVIYGRMPYAFAKGSMQRADILLNLANDNANQIPSKIFEYMMCLKPILNIYSVEGDVGTEYLRKYPLALNYNNRQKTPELNKVLMEWAESIDDRSITINELDAIFHEVTTAVVTERFCKLCDRLIDNI